MTTEAQGGDLTGAAAFLAAAAAFAERLRGRRAIFEVHYHGLAFGSWTLVAGTPKRRVRLFWDGREGDLSAETAVLGSSHERPPWQLAERRHPADRAPVALLALAEELLLLHSDATAA